MLLQLVCRGCLQLGTEVESEFAGLAVGVCSSCCCRCSNCSDSRGRRGRVASSVSCCSSNKVLGCLPYRSLAGLGARAAAAAAASGGFRLAADVAECLLEQPPFAKRELMLLLQGDIVRYPFTEDVIQQFKQRARRLETMQKGVRAREQQLQRQHATTGSSSSGRGAGRDRGPTRPFRFLASLGGMLLGSLLDTLRDTWANAANKLRGYRASCCCDSESRCGRCRCCSCSSIELQQQKLHYTKHGAMHMPHAVYRRYRRLLELAGPLQDEMRLQTARREELLRQHVARHYRSCCAHIETSSSDSSSSSRDTSSDSSSSSSSRWQTQSPQARLKMMPRSVHPFFSQLMRAPYGCLLLQQQTIMWSEELAKASQLAAGPLGLPSRKDGSDRRGLWQEGRERGTGESCLFSIYPALGRRRNRSLSPLHKMPRVGDECVICLEPFAPEAVMTRYPGCSHAYHLSCLGTWIDWKNKGSPSSPLARTVSSHAEQQEILISVATLLVQEDEAVLQATSCLRNRSRQRWLQHERRWSQYQQSKPATSSRRGPRSPSPQRFPYPRDAAPGRVCGCPSLNYRERNLNQSSTSRYLPRTDRAASAAGRNETRRSVPMGRSRAAECRAFPELGRGDLDEPTCARRLTASIGAAGPVPDGVSLENSGGDLPDSDGDERIRDAVIAAHEDDRRTATAAIAAEVHGAAAAGVQGCNTWAQLLSQLRDIEYWMATAATGPQLATSLMLLEARGLPLSGMRTPGFLRPLRAFKDRCPMCQHTVTDSY